MRWVTRRPQGAGGRARRSWAGSCQQEPTGLGSFEESGLRAGLSGAISALGSPRQLLVAAVWWWPIGADFSLESGRQGSRLAWALPISHG